MKIRDMFKVIYDDGEDGCWGILKEDYAYKDDQEVIVAPSKEAFVEELKHIHRREINNGSKKTI